MAALRQTNFLGGELDPKLWGRSDLPLFHKGLRRCLNFIIGPHGSAISRPGTTYVAKVGPNSSDVRLVPFIVSDSEAYLLEIANGRIRVYKNLARVTLTGTGTVDGDLECDFVTGDLPKLQWAQIGDALYFVAGFSAPLVLRRTAAGSPPTFEMAVASFEPEMPTTKFVDINNQASASRRPHLYNADGTPFNEDASHPAREWKWMVSAILRNNTTGAVFETLATPIIHYSQTGDQNSFTLLGDTHVVLYPDRALTLSRDGFGNESTTYDGAYTVLSYQFYRGRADLFGFIGTTKTTLFVDVGGEPNYLIPPLRGYNPVTGLYSGQTGTDLQRIPAAIAFFQERLWLGGFSDSPTTLRASYKGNYRNFDKPFFPYATQPLELTIASRKREDVRTICQHQRLLIGTDSCIRSMTGSEIEAGGIGELQVEDEVGIAVNVPFLICNGTPLFVRSKGRGVRALSINTSGTGYSGVDISWHSQHLFLGGEGVIRTSETRQIKRWAWQENPNGVVWAVRYDGVLLSGTLAPTGEVAWAQHYVGQFVHDVCVVPEPGSDDAVYMVVERSGGFYVERLASRVINDGAFDGVSVDCHKIYIGDLRQTFEGLEHLEGESVYFTAKGNVPQGPYVVTDGAITLDLMPLANYQGSLIAFIGIKYTPELETLDAVTTDTRLRQKTLVRAGFEVDNARGVAVGQDSEHLVEWQQHQVSDGYLPPPPATALVDVLVVGSWEKGARLFLRQTKPLPVTVLGVVREIEMGD